MMVPTYASLTPPRETLEIAVISGVFAAAGSVGLLAKPPWCVAESSMQKRGTQRGALAALAAAGLVAASVVLPGTVGPVQSASAAPGSLQISMVIDDPSGGYIGGSSKTYSGGYDCGSGFAGTFGTLTTATPVTIAGIPEGQACTVTANTPTGGLLNASFSWATATYSAQPVTIGDAATAMVQITQPVLQSFGTVELTKALSGPGGYTGGTSRVFPVGYSCTLANGPTTSGSVNLTTAAPVQTSAVPVGSSCTFSETLATQPGDFADAAALWTGKTFSPSAAVVGAGTPVAVTVTNTYTGPSGQLAINNTVTGAGYVGTGAPFLFDYVCGADAGQLAVAANASASVTVRAGVACTVQQQAPDAALLAAGYTWGAPAWSTVTTATLTDGGTATLAITNPIVAPTALAATGGSASFGGVWLGLGMLLMGGATVVAIGRRRGRSDLVELRSQPAPNSRR